MFSGNEALVGIKGSSITEVNLSKVAEHPKVYNLRYCGKSLKS